MPLTTFLRLMVSGTTCELTGHDADTAHWTWADLNFMQEDLAGFRGVVSENPFSIADPQVLDWAYISGESRWVRRNSSTWVYSPAPAQFVASHRTQRAAERSGLTTVGKFIFSTNKHRMRIIRAYAGSVPGAPQYTLHSFNSETVNLENFARTDFNTQVQARKLATFDGHDVATIPDDGERFFRLTARVHTDPTGTLTSYDLAQWEPSTGGNPWRRRLRTGRGTHLYFRPHDYGLCEYSNFHSGDGFLYVDIRAGDSVDTPQ